MKNKIIVIHHSADFDGLFCREIARKFLEPETAREDARPTVEYIGWDFGDAPLAIPDAGTIYVLDLPVDRVFGFEFTPNSLPPQFGGGSEKPVALVNLIWIDHHKSSIESHPKDIPGYRIDGVSACRLAWQWFLKSDRDPLGMITLLPDKTEFIERRVQEPYAVQLAGEYDVLDRRNPDAEVFQFGLRSLPVDLHHWNWMLSAEATPDSIGHLMANGRMLQRYQQEQDKSIVERLAFLVEFEGLKFLALNSTRFNSLTFAAKDVPETGHDALMGFCWDGMAWKVSLYHARHLTELDLSEIASKHGGGGHRGACGFRATALPFIMENNSPTWPFVLEFARRMEKKLVMNRDKGNRVGWLKDHPWQLVERMLDETAEVQQCFKDDGQTITFNNAEKLADECADVANFAMMIADNAIYHAT